MEKPKVDQKRLCELMKDDWSTLKYIVAILLILSSLGFVFEFLWWIWTDSEIALKVAGTCFIFGVVSNAVYKAL